jgi:hypothetical protein
VKRYIVTIAFLLFATANTMAASVGVFGNGRVNSRPPGIDCRQIGVGCTLPFAGVVTLTVTPDTGNVFVGWGGACSGKSPTCQVKVDPKSQVQVTATFNWRNIYLLLHGMNSDATTWNDLVDKNKTFFGSSCPQMTGFAAFTDVIPSDEKEKKQFFAGKQCFRINFNTTQGRPKGDGSTFNELGTEVGNAVTEISKLFPDSVITLVGHSRGGLAARAFLQGSSSSRSKVVGLLTIGTPHQGSPLGRMYTWLGNHSRPPKKPTKDCKNPRGEAVYCNIGNPPTSAADIFDDWNAADFILRNSGLDIGSPTVKYLATDSSEINALNQGVSKLDKNIRYAQIVSTAVQFGVLSSAYDVWGGTWGLSYPSQSAKNYILNPTTTTSNTRDSYRGDGIVPSDSQRMNRVSGFSSTISVGETTLTSPVRHTDETGRLTEIINALNSIAR